ncbi:type IV secretory system conjugative DNA transfer family protein [Crystallibacter crystallopoietes]|nr:type IV secretory system conjugative DNA transfer family protein [Arthrobacter crystallopoietes]
MSLRIYRLARSGGIETNPTTFGQRAGAFASAATELGTATLLTRREPTGLNGYLILPEKSVNLNAALHLGQTVGARAEIAELSDDLADVPVIGELVFRPSPALRETQAGIDPTELPRLLANTIPAGAWVAATLRAPSTRERKHHTAWLSHRLGTAVPVHHSMSANAVVMTITAGGSSREEVRSMLHQVTAGLPGFDLDSDVVFPARRHRFVFGLAVGALLAAATLFGLPQIPYELPGWLPVALYGVAAIAAAVGLGALTGRIKSPDTRLRSRLDRADFPAPPARRGKPSPPRKERTIKGQNGAPDKQLPASDGDYPFAPNSFIVAPTVIVGMVSPHAGAVSGETVTRSRATPPAMLQPIGPMIGTNEDGRAHLSAPELLFGTAIVGRPGSGKSVITRTLFGWSCLERVRPSGRPGYPGSRNALIAFESKGDGVDKYLGWAHALGDKALLVDVGDPSTRAIDMFAVPGDNAARASFFTNAMRYAFGDQAIGDRSFETLVAVLTAALTVTDEVLEMIEGRNGQFIPLGRSPIFYAHLLLGGHSDATGVELGNGIKSVAVKLRNRDTPNLELEAAYTAIASLYEGRTESARRSFLEAPRNKISQLLALDHWWSPARPKITWEQVLSGHRSVIINTGSPRNGMMLDDSQNQQMSSLLMYSLQHAIKRVCSGWLEQGRSVSLFADELALLAGSSPEVISWLRDQGRSYGCRPFLATQRPEQLPALLRNNILTYATLISFAQNDPTTAREIADNVATGGDWSAEDIQHLEPFTVVVRSQVDQRRQSAFIVKLPNFEADMAGYPAAQGYAAVTA